MPEITISNVHLVSDDEFLTIIRLDQPDVRISLDSAGVKELINFVTSHAGSELDRRRTFRVTVWDNSGLTVRLRSGGNECPATPTDISLTGIFVKLCPADWIDLALDDELEAILEFGGRTQTYRVLVRRSQANGYGLLFADSLAGEQINPPPGVTGIVMELQRRWVAQHIKRIQ